MAENLTLETQIIAIDHPRNDRDAFELRQMVTQNSSSKEALNTCKVRRYYVNIKTVNCDDKISVHNKNIGYKADHVQTCKTIGDY